MTSAVASQGFAPVVRTFYGPLNDLHDHKLLRFSGDATPCVEFGTADPWRLPAV